MTDRIVTARMVTTAEAAKALGRSPSTLRSWRKRGKGPPHWSPVPGATCLYDERDVAAFKELLKKD